MGMFQYVFILLLFFLMKENLGPLVHQKSQLSPPTVRRFGASLL